MELALAYQDERDELIEIIVKMFVKNGSYNIKPKDAKNFASDILWRAEDKYIDERYHREFSSFEYFLRTHIVDTIAYNVFIDYYSDEEEEL